MYLPTENKNNAGAYRGGVLLANERDQNEGPVLLR